MIVLPGTVPAAGESVMACLRTASLFVCIVDGR